METEVETLFDNWNLLRAEMDFEKERFLIEHAGKFNTKGDEMRALINHLNRKYKKQSDLLLEMKLGIINQEEKTI